MRSKRFIVVGVAVSAFLLAWILFGAMVSRDTLICYDAQGAVVEQDQKYVWPWQDSPAMRLEKYCADRGYQSAALIHIDLYGYHKITYFYGWHAARVHAAGGTVLALRC